MKIGLDIDDVVTPTFSKVLNYYNQTYGDSIKYEDVNEWDLSKSLPKIQTDEQKRQLFKGFTYSGGFTRALPLPEAASVISRWNRQGYEITFVSARNSNGISDTYRSFVKRGLPIDRVFFDRDKAWHAEINRFDVFVDDNTENLTLIKAASPNTRTVLYLQPWNRANGGQEHAIDFAAPNWNVLEDIVRALDRGRRAENSPDPEAQWRNKPPQGRQDPTWHPAYWTLPEVYWE